MDNEKFREARGSWGEENCLAAFSPVQARTIFSASSKFNLADISISFDQGLLFLLILG